jgi:hypothetical protein
MKKQEIIAASIVAVWLLTACGGGGNLPNGSVVNSPGGGDPPPTKLVNVKVTVSIPARERAHGIRPGYVSVNTKSLVIQLTSVDGGGVSGVNPTTIETAAKARGCKLESRQLVCSTTASGSPGNDVFAVTTYQGSNATGSVLSVGTVQAKIAAGGGGVQISNSLALSLGGVIASLKVALSPSDGKRGTPTRSAVSLEAYDASGAQIVGPSDFAEPVTLSVQGDNGKSFTLRAGSRSGASLLIAKPASNIALDYNGNRDASSVSVHGIVTGPSGVGTSANFALKGRQPPPPVGTIYALNLGANDGRAATVTEYDGKASGNAKPVRTLVLSSKLYARSIAVDASNNLYVGYVDNQFGFSPSSGLPDKGNEIATYAPGASGNAQPTSVLTADQKTSSTIFPVYLTIDPSGNLVTYGATSVDGSNGNDAVLSYPPGSTGAAAPADAWAYYYPTLYYSGPTGLALDSAGNFYVSAALHSSLGPSYGLFVTPASDNGNPSVTPSRTIPWDTTTGLNPGLTTNVALNSSGELFVGNNATQGSGSAISCQGRANVFAAGASGGTTDVPPLRVLTLGGIVTQNAECVSSRDILVAYFPSVFLYSTTLFATDDFNNAIDAYPSGAHGTVKPTLKISGSATGLNAPVMLVVTQNSPT